MNQLILYGNKSSIQKLLCWIKTIDPYKKMYVCVGCSDGLVKELNRHQLLH